MHRKKQLQIIEKAYKGEDKAQPSSSDVTLFDSEPGPEDSNPLSPTLHQIYTQQQLCNMELHKKISSPFLFEVPLFIHHRITRFISYFLLKILW